MRRLVRVAMQSRRMREDVMRMQARMQVRIGKMMAALLVASFLWTPASAQDVDQILYETFDGVTAPALPDGWTTTGGAWVTSTSAESGGSGGNNLVNSGSAAGELLLPPLNLTGATSGEITFLARRTASYDVANVRISASIDGGATFSIEVAAPGDALPAETSTYEEVTIPLPGALLGETGVVLRFEAFGLSGSSANARIDDFSVILSRLVIASPADLSMRAVPGAPQQAVVSLRNAHVSDLQVDPPMLEGPSFSVDPVTAVVVPAGGTQTYTVTYAPTSKENETGMLLFMHDQGTSEISLEGIAVGGIFEFASDTTDAGGDSLVVVPMDLTFADDHDLQGLQFHLSWDNPDVELANILRGAAIADEAAWSVSFQNEPAAATVVLLGSGTTGLPTGAYQNLLSLSFMRDDSTEAVFDTVAVELTQVVGALAVAGGDDADVVLGRSQHLAILEQGIANFFAFAGAIALDPVAVGDSASVTLTISNPEGTVPLVIYSVASSNALFQVVPDSMAVPPDSSADFRITFAPTDTAFGEQEANLWFYHNGEAGVDSVLVSAIGTGGRGDAASDGIVDAVDLVQVLDFVLLRTQPDSLQLASGDLYPFPEGDGALDVRDLTVLSHAIVNAYWPDSIAIPVIPAMVPGAEMQLAQAATPAGAAGDEIQIKEKWTLALETSVPVRALQVVLAATSVADVRHLETADRVGVVTMYTRDDKHVRVVSYRADGGEMEAGIHELVEIEPNGGGGSVRPLYAIGVGEDLKRVPVAVSGAGLEDAENEVPGDVLRLGLPYPNPVRFLSGERLRLPLAGRPSGGRSRAAVFNILGQRVRRLDVPARGETVLEWDGRDQRGGLVSPGIYFIRLEGMEGLARSFVHIR